MLDAVVDAPDSVDDEGWNAFSKKDSYIMRDSHVASVFVARVRQSILVMNGTKLKELRPFAPVPPVPRM